MNILWNVLEIAVNIYQGFLFIWFPYKFLGSKNGCSFVQNHGLLFATIEAILITLLDLSIELETMLFPLYFVPGILFALLFLNGKLLVKLFSCIYPLFIAVLVSVSVTSISTLLFHISAREILPAWNASMERTAVLFSNQIVLYYGFILSLKLFQKGNIRNRSLSKSEWLLIVSVLLMTLGLGVVLNNMTLDAVSTRSRILIFICLILLISINIVVVSLVIDLDKKNLAIQNAELEKLKAEYNQQYLKNADTDYQLIQKLRHDSKDIYTVVSDYLKQGETKQALQYLHQMYEIMDDRSIFVHTENDAVNSVINAKLTIAKSFGIQVTCISVDAFKGMEDIDLCRLLSNMLENAITATNQCEEKRMELKISEKNGTYTFFLRNSVEQSVLEGNPTLKTTKKDKHSHGYGTQIIRDIAEKYSGRCDFYEEHGYFCCMVILHVTTE